MLDLKKKGKKESIKFVKKKIWTIPDSEHGTFAPETTLNAVCYEDNYSLVGKFKLFFSLFHTVYLVFSSQLRSIEGTSRERSAVHVSEIVYPEPNVSLYCCLLDTIQRDVRLRIYNFAYMNSRPLSTSPSLYCCLLDTIFKLT